MVNTGKPSKACRLCKQRRIKCDEGRPGCMRCKAVGKACPGYQDRWDVIFHDETSSTQHKAQQREKPGGKHERTVTKAAPVQNEYVFINDNEFDHYGSPLPVVDMPSIADMAINSLLNTLSSLTMPTHCQGWLDMVAPTYLMSRPDSSIRAASDAVAVGWMWRKTHMKELEEPSLAYYNRALRATQNALSDPESMTSDATLMSILLLANFESLHCSYERTQAFRRHIVGAVRLVETRGTVQFKNLTSVRLFWNVRASLLHSRLTTSQRATLDADFDWFPDEACDPSPTTSLHRIGIDVASLRADCKELFEIHGATTQNSDVRNLVLRARDLILTLDDWNIDLPAEYRSTTTLADANPDVPISERSSWTPLASTYQGLMQATIAATFYILRIYLHAVVVRCACWLRFPEGLEDGQLVQMKEYQPMKEAADAICSIIPYSLGDVSCFQAHQNDLQEANRAMFSMSTPLATVLSIEGLAEDQREWVRGRFDRIADTKQIEMARLLKRSPQVLIFQGINPYRQVV